MENEVMISVIIPVYNAEKYLNTSITAVLNQTYTDYELILINDGSTDNSEKICREYAEKDSRIKYFYKENGGVCSARNFGLQQAGGRYIFFMDNDDEIDRRLFEDNIALLEKNNADIVKFEKTRKEYRNGELTKEVVSDGIRKLKKEIGAEGIVIFSDKDMKKMLYPIYKYNMLMYIWTGIYRRTLFTEHRLQFNEDFKNGHEDILMNMQCYRYAKKIVLNDKAYYTHNWRVGTSASSIFTMNRIKDAIVVANHEKQLFEDFGYGRDIILSLYMDNMYICLAMMNTGENKCKKSVQKKILRKYKKNISDQMGDFSKDIRRLFKKKMYKHACLAKLVNMNAFGLILFSYRLYAKCVQ